MYDFIYNLISVFLKSSLIPKIEMHKYILYHSD